MAVLCTVVVYNANIDCKRFFFNLTPHHVHQLNRGYKPDKNKVEDMCLFADVITNFANLKECYNYSNLYDWGFNCKVTCSINISNNQQQQMRNKILFESCNHQLRNTTISFRSDDPCLGKALQKLYEDKSKVPNIVHYIWLGTKQKQFKFYNFLSLYSVYKFQNPCVILIHGETVPYGEYWEKTVRIVKNIFHVYRKSPETIFRKKIKHIEHKADIVRLQVLREYGGIYLDTDTILLRSLDSLRNYTFSMSKTRKNTLGNGLILSAAGSKFIDIWLRNYNTFNPKKWGQHSVYLPFDLSIRNPELIHVENRTFLHGGTLDQIFLSNFKWSHLYALHLYIRYYKKCTYDEYTVCGLNTTLGSVARHVLFDSKELCSRFPLPDTWVNTKL
ncbi:hypothetical protein KUTeg_009619 [Tegillarca granosa]|uniref:Alpha-1,4-N-acetylglucosaminyltransferase n=1 Tax=Tegillarca granosa TaxID=220873 RepID=A0ABQ9F4E8_TEGGR|nr:hypothetical protein KUTeg_009619 [Tegillarca granosa]